MANHSNDQLARRLSPVAFELRRLTRDPKFLAGWIGIFGVPPLVIALAGPNGANTLLLTSLFLPVLVGWNWGEDLARDRLVPLGLARPHVSRLLATRVLLVGGATAVCSAAVLPFAQGTTADHLLILVVPLHYLLIGFFLATLSRGPQAGWLPIFLAVVGVWVPLLVTLKANPHAQTPFWIRALSLIVVPQLGLALELFTPGVAAPFLVGLSAAWFGFASVLLRRRPRSRGAWTREGELLSVENVTKCYRFPERVVALRGITLSLSRRQGTVLLGPNGAGKSTLLRLLLGLDRPTSGRISWPGGHVPQAGFAPERESLFPEATVADALRLWSGGRPLHERREWVDRLQLSEILGRRMGALSRGETKRVSLALAFAANPELVVLDEPYEGLDPLVRPLVRTAIATCLRRADAPAMLVSTHRLEEVREPFQRVIVLHKGSLVRDLELRELEALREATVLLLDPATQETDVRRIAQAAAAPDVRAVRGLYGEQPAILVGPCSRNGSSDAARPIDLETLLQLWLNSNLLGDDR